jgi:hypothetical protein
MELDKISMSCDNFNASFEGGDISYLVNSLTGIVTGFTRDYLMQTFDAKMRKALSDTINDKFVKMPHTYNAHKGHFAMDYGLV